jgi:AcrR family transcriptional regulator
LKKTFNVNTINFVSIKSTPPIKSPHYHHGNLHDALLNAAIDVMAEKGVSQFSLSELARNAGVTPAAAYKHFADKDALLAELAQHGFTILRMRFEEAAAKSKPALNVKQAILRFERIGQAYLKFGQDEPALFHLIFGNGASAFRKEVAANADRTPTFAYFAEALEDLYKFGAIANTPSPNDQWFAWSAIHGATELMVSGINGLVKPEHAAKVITTSILKALR